MLLSVILFVAQDEDSHVVGWSSVDLTGSEQVTHQGREDMLSVNGISLHVVRYRQDVDVDDNGC